MHKICLTILVTAVLSGCGGGGGSNTPSSVTPTPTPAPTQTGPSWKLGKFDPASDFKDKCAVVRTHKDINGDAYPDVAGSVLEEKLWLRSWSNDTYLWYREIDDVNPENYSSPQDYFSVLKTEQKTPSGTNKDNFHFFRSTDEHESFSESGIQTGYGINWVFLASTPPRDIRVSTVDAGSSAGAQGVKRSDKLIRINDEDAVNGNNVSFLNKALYPSAENTKYDFTFARADGSEVTYTLTSGDFDTSFVNNRKVLDTLSGKVGYLRFDGFQIPAQTPLIESFQHFVDENVTDLVFDLRYNGGGRLAMSSQLGYMIAGPAQTTGKAFETLQYNDKTADDVPTPFYNREIDWEKNEFTSKTLPTLNLTRVFVITTGRTCSASEALINGLRGIDVEVVQIGNTTCGKPYGFVPTDNCGTTYYTIQFEGVNNKGFGAYADGFKPKVSPQFDDELPGCEVNDDLNHQLGDTKEAMLFTALERLQSGDCPVSTDSAGTQRKAQRTLSAEHSELSILDPRFRSFLQNNRIVTPIKDATDE